MILIVDDDDAIRASLGMVLKKGGFSVQSAAAPKEALEKLAVMEAELVIADMNFTIETSGEEGLVF